MLRLRLGSRVMLFFVIVLADHALLGTTAAQKAAVPKPQNRLALAEEHVKQVLLFIDTDKQGRVTKQLYMKFMEAEFDRLDNGKTGALDVKALTQGNATVSRYLGK